MFKIKEVVLSLKVKSVNYFGTILDVSDDMNYIATDIGGDVYSYTTKPTTDGQSHTWCGISDDYDDYECFIANVKFEGDWKESLMVIENV